MGRRGLNGVGNGVGGVGIGVWVLSVYGTMHGGRFVCGISESLNSRS
jgi:hypothetical protein